MPISRSPYATIRTPENQVMLDPDDPWYSGRDRATLDVAESLQSVASMAWRIGNSTDKDLAFHMEEFHIRKGFPPVPGYRDYIARDHGCPRARGTVSLLEAPDSRHVLARNPRSAAHFPPDGRPESVP